MPESKPTKQCSKCKTSKSIEDFYRRIDASDGLQHACKTCQNSNHLRYSKTETARATNSKYIRTYRQTKKGKAMFQLSYRKWRTSEKGKQALSRYRGSDKTKARTAVFHAVRRGQLKRPENCSLCGVQCKPASHHHKGYAPEFWLDVQWLCSGCHGLTYRREPRAQHQTVQTASK